MTNTNSASIKGSLEDAKKVPQENNPKPKPKQTHLNVIVEVGEDGTLWGRAKLNGDLLVTAGDNEEELARGIKEQLQAFYPSEDLIIKLTKDS